jgi:hypothetical protein
MSWICIAPSIFTRYHDANNLPVNFIAIGDSIMKLNPIFGYVFAFI